MRTARALLFLGAVACNGSDTDTDVGTDTDADADTDTDTDTDTDSDTDSDTDACTEDKVIFETTDGAEQDITPFFTSGDYITLAVPGTVKVCPSTWFARMIVRADVSIIGLGANPEDTVLSGGESGTILDVLGPNITVDVQNVTFDRGAGLDVDHNSGGGGIYCEQQGVVNVDNAAFTNNFANDGAAIYVRDCRLNVKTASFEGNTSDDDGGAVTIWYGDATLDDTHFNDNQALDGGAIAVFSGALTVTNSTFADSRATSFGGAIWMAYDSDLVMSDTTISTSVNSGSQYGGALLIHGTADLDRVTLTNNEARLGAGIYVSAGSVVDGSYCNFSNNDPDDIYAAGESGGGTAYAGGSNYSFICQDHACADR